MGQAKAGPRRLKWLSAHAEMAVGIGVLIALAASSFVVPSMSHTSVDALVDVPSQAPSDHHPFGTDQLGRDMLVRVFYAIRIDLGITLAAVLISLAIGVATGLLIGLSPRPIAEFLQRFIDAVLAIPYLVFVLAIVAFTRTHTILPFLPGGVAAIVLALAVTGWANYARITAGQTRILVSRESVIAVRLLGFSTARIVARHIVPEVIRPNISLAGSHAVLVTAASASLAFLGAGVTPPTPELGAIMQGGTALIRSAWWIAVIPGIAIVLIGLGFSLIADARED